MHFRLPKERVEALQEALQRVLKQEHRSTAQGEFKDLQVVWNVVVWETYRMPNSPLSTVITLTAKPSIRFIVGSGTTSFGLTSRHEIGMTTATGQVEEICDDEDFTETVSDVLRKAMRQFAKRKKTK